MADRTSGRALAALGRIFRFRGGISHLDTFDLSAPIQPVLDISRLGELGAIETDPTTGGFIQVQLDNTHAIADTQASNLDPYAGLQPSWGVAGERWLWLQGFYGIGNNPALTSAQLSVMWGAVGLATAGDRSMLAQYTGTQQFQPFGGYDEGFTTTVLQQPGLKLPIPLLPGCQITWRSVSSGAMSARLVLLMQLLPTGVYP